MKIEKKIGRHRIVFIVKTKNGGFVIKLCKVRLFQALELLRDYIVWKLTRKNSLADIWPARIKEALFGGIIENAREFICFNFFDSNAISKGCLYFIFINVCPLVNKIATTKSYHKADGLLMRQIHKKTGVDLPFSFKTYRDFYVNFLLICHSTFDVGLRNNKPVIFDGGSEYLLCLLKHYPKELEILLDWLLNTKKLIKFKEV